jgi:hypothetical protein
MFQATTPTKTDTQRLIRTINRAVSGEPVPEQNLDRLFEKMWSDLEEKITTMPQSGSSASATRPLEEIMTEILELARGEADSRKFVEGRISTIEDMLDSLMGSFGYQRGITFGPALAQGASDGYFGNSLVSGVRPLSSFFGTPREAPNATKSETDAKSKQKK